MTTNINIEKSINNIDVKGCTGIAELPDYSKLFNNIDVKGCTGIAELPEGYKIPVIDCTTLTDITDSTVKDLRRVQIMVKIWWVLSLLAFCIFCI